MDTFPTNNRKMQPHHQHNGKNHHNHNASNGTNEAYRSRKNGSSNAHSHNYRINHQIKSPTVRLVFESECGAQRESVVVPLGQAISDAISSNQDLIEIAPQANPPVCKIMEIGKFLYREQKSHKHEKKTKSKEIGFHVNIAEHDFCTKMRQACEFLEAHNQVMFKLQFRGRECAHKEIGLELFKRIQEHLKDKGSCDGSPKVNGKIAILRFSPKRTK